MTTLKRALIVATASAVLPLFVATAASAESATVKAVTHAANHPDTCACTTDELSSNGYVWAYDNLARQFTVTSEGGEIYTVVITDNGSFAAFAEPNNADLNTFFPITANGSIRGTITYTVQATEGPDPSALPPQMPGDVSTTEMINTLFQDSVIGPLSGGDYTYTYRAGGDTYVQSSSSGITGDITGHP